MTTPRRAAVSPDNPARRLARAWVRRRAKPSRRRRRLVSRSRSGARASADTESIAGPHERGDREVPPIETLLDHGFEVGGHDLRGRVEDGPRRRRDGDAIAPRHDVRRWQLPRSVHDDAGERSHATLLGDGDVDVATLRGPAELPEAPCGREAGDAAGERACHRDPLLERVDRGGVGEDTSPTALEPPATGEAGDLAFGQPARPSRARVVTPWWRWRSAARTRSSMSPRSQWSIGNAGPPDNRRTGVSRASAETVVPQRYRGFRRSRAAAVQIAVGQVEKPSRRASTWSITSSAPPPMPVRRLSRRKRAVQFSST